MKTYIFVCRIGRIKIEAENIFTAYDMAKSAYAQFMASGYELFRVEDYQK